MLKTDRGVRSRNLKSGVFTFAVSRFTTADSPLTIHVKK
jgi:hypothetical protein